MDNAGGVTDGWQIVFLTDSQASKKTISIMNMAPGLSALNITRCGFTVGVSALVIRSFGDLIQETLQCGSIMTFLVLQLSSIKQWH